MQVAYTLQHATEDIRRRRVTTKLAPMRSDGRRTYWRIAIRRSTPHSFPAAVAVLLTLVTNVSCRKLPRSGLRIRWKICSLPG